MRYYMDPERMLESLHRMLRADDQAVAGISHPFDRSTIRAGQFRGALEALVSSLERELADAGKIVAKYGQKQDQSGPDPGGGGPNGDK